MASKLKLMSPGEARAGNPFNGINCIVGTTKRFSKLTSAYHAALADLEQAEKQYAVLAEKLPRLREAVIHLAESCAEESEEDAM